MNTKPLGQTGLTVTAIGLGMAALGRPGYINLDHGRDLSGGHEIDAMRANSHKVLDAAWQLGIRYFDAARSYGRAEQFLGSWLSERAIKPSEVCVGSKWGYIYTADWQVVTGTHEVKEHTLENLNRQVTESHNHLTPWLRLYQIHSATLESGVLENLPVLKRLGELRDDGMVIGLSVSGPGQSVTLARAMEIAIDGRPLFGAVQATWNLLAQEAGPTLNVAHQAGLGVIVKESLANGRLTTRNNDPGFGDQMALLKEMAGAHETTVDALAMAAVLAQPWAGCVLSGATTANQLTSNCAAVNINLTDDELALLTVSLAESADVYWTTRGNLTWN